MAAGGREWSKLLVRGIMWAPVAIFFTNHIASVVRIEGRSMQPSLNPDTNLLRRDVTIVNKTVTTTQNLNKGDIVTLWSPTNPDRLITKRILAMPGDCIVPLSTHNAISDSLIRIPKGHCWVEGDESMHSVDSNMFGPIPLGLIHGRVSFIIWPFSRLGSVDSQVPEWKRKRIYGSNL